MRIRARMVLTEIPLDVELEVDPVFWVTSNEEEQAKVIWQGLEMSHPLCAEVAIQNTKLYPKTSWIENIEIVTD